MKKLRLLLISSSLFLLTSCADWFQTKVPMDSETNNQDLSGLFQKKEEIKSLDAPAQIFTSQGLFSGRIQLSWSDVKNATSYRIERAVVTSPNSDGTYAVPEESDFETLKDFNYSSEYTDTILSNPGTTNKEYGYHYFYKITAQNFELNIESDPTDPEKPETRGEGWIFSVPSNVDASKGKSTDEIQLSWNGVKEAVFYKIYRGEKENGSGMELLETVRGNQLSFTNTLLKSEQGTEFYYKVVAQNSSGYDSAYSPIAMGYSLKEGAPATPDNVQVVDGFATSKTELKIKWDEVTPTTSTSTITYSLYRTSSVDSVYTLVKNKLTTPECTDSSGLKTGIYYYYYVQAIAFDSATQETLKSSFSEKSDESYGYLISPPDEFEVQDSATEGKVNLIWSKAIGSESLNFTYNIYHSETQDGTYLLLENTSGTPSEDGYLSLEVEKKNFYKISTLNGSLESVLSFAAAPQPNAPQNVTASKTLELGKDFIPNKNNVYPVKITWEKPSDDNPAAYNVYRSSKPSSGFRKLTDTPVAELEYIDSNESAKSGAFYYYKVVSVNSLGQGKKGNNPKDDLSIANGSNLAQIKSLGYGALTRDQWFREYNKTVMNSQKKLTLMHKPNDMDKLGSESVNGNISGTLSYNAKIAGLGAEIVMPYKDYADYCITSESTLITTKENTLSVYFLLNGNNDTSSNMSANGHMSGTVKCQGMYPGAVNYNTLEIKGGGAGGGYYGVTLYDLNEKELNVITNQDRNRNPSSANEVHWLVGEEGR